MVKCYKTKNLDSYYLEMGATEGFIRAEIEKLEKENRKIKGNMGYLVRENRRLKEKLEKWGKDYREGIIVHCRNG